MQDFDLRSRNWEIQTSATALKYRRAIAILSATTSASACKMSGQMLSNVSMFMYILLHFNSVILIKSLKTKAHGSRYPVTLEHVVYCASSLNLS